MVNDMNKQISIDTNNNIYKQLNDNLSTTTIFPTILSTITPISNITNNYNNISNISNSTDTGGSPLLIYSCPIIIIIGTICNILTFLVMRRQKLKHQSTGFYMAVLAIADELVLLVGCTICWLYEYKRISVLHISSILCKLFSVLLYTTLDFSVWMVVIMTIERFIAVTYPLKSIYVCTIKKAKMATFILAIVVFVINSHFLFTHSYLQRPGDNAPGCQSKSTTYDVLMNSIWPWIDASKYSFIPLATIIVFNILIIHNLIKASSSMQNLLSANHTPTSSNNKSRPSSTTATTSSQSNPSANHNNSTASTTVVPSTASSNNRRLTVMLLVVSITFCILSTPVVILQILVKEKMIDETNTKYKISYSICVFLQYINHSINFFLYAITGKIFRRECIALFAVCSRCLKKNIKTKSSNTTTLTNNYTNSRNSAANSVGLRNKQSGGQQKQLNIDSQNKVKRENKRLSLVKIKEANKALNECNNDSSCNCEPLIREKTTTSSNDTNGTIKRSDYSGSNQSTSETTTEPNQVTKVVPKLKHEKSLEIQTNGNLFETVV